MWIIKIEQNWIELKSIKRCSYNDIDKSFLPVATKLLFNFQVFHFTYARNTSQFLSVSCVEVSLCCGEAGEKEKDSARGTMGRGMREERLPPFPLPIVLGALSIFSIIAIFIGIPNRSLCGGESPSSVCSNLSRKEGKRRWFVKVSSLVRWWYK